MCSPRRLRSKAARHRGQGVSWPPAPSGPSVPHLPGAVSPQRDTRTRGPSHGASPVAMLCSACERTLVSCSPLTEDLYHDSKGWLRFL